MSIASVTAQQNSTNAAAATAHEAIMVRMGVLFSGMVPSGNDLPPRSFLPPTIISI